LRSINLAEQDAWHRIVSIRDTKQSRPILLLCEENSSPKRLRYTSSHAPGIVGCHSVRFARLDDEDDVLEWRSRTQPVGRPNRARMVACISPMKCEGRYQMIKEGIHKTKRDIGLKWGKSLASRRNCRVRSKTKKPRTITLATAIRIWSCFRGDETAPG